jgi:hypothetical protein
MDTTIANCWLKSRVLGPQMTPITRSQALRGGWQEAVEEGDRELATTIRQMRATLHQFKQESQIKKAMDIYQFISPDTERVEDPVHDTDLVEEIASAYSLTPGDGPEEELDLIIEISSARVLSAIQTIKEWDEQHNDGTYVILRLLQTFEKARQTCTDGRTEAMDLI